MLLRVMHNFNILLEEFVQNKGSHLVSKIFNKSKLPTIILLLLGYILIKYSCFLKYTFFKTSSSHGPSCTLLYVRQKKEQNNVWLYNYIALFSVLTIVTINEEADYRLNRFNFWLFK